MKLESLKTNKAENHKAGAIVILKASKPYSFPASQPSNYELYVHSRQKTTMNCFI